ncbi:competence/damage-inducible protein A [uncultured Sunxiuqinia sp.]|uniref:competence/damage-inducible protein A n=1 Tax=uncultured Sunxiuqinia sp. TaxID=1573825 RepID=UPI00261BD380|nr:competence/damage-inducible protein A [uncultured Sunxiuqinia sp.]
MKAEIITIGDEILIGQVVDTNSAWMGEQLNLHGIEVFQITSVHDKHDHIMEALANAEKHADLVLITGGLGPTKDDITKKVLCDYFDSQLVLDESVLQRVTERLTKRNVAMNQLNKDQALVPDKCTVLTNSTGTAPGMWFEKNDTIFVSMPGVPFEMKSIMSEEVLPRLASNGKAKSIYHQTVLVYGIPESMLAEKIEHWEEALPDFIKLAYLPSQLMIRLRLSAYGNQMEQMQTEVHRQIDLLKLLIPENIFGYNGDTLAGVTGQLLARLGATLSIAESCTGGNIAHLFTSNPGSSAYLKGGIVAYSNEVKTAVLGVKPQTLEAHGAVSQEVALEMAQGVQQVLQTDYAIATTGIAGPDGGTPDKPVGTVWIAVISKHNIKLERYTFAHNRERNILRSSQAAINLLRQLILTEQPSLA